MWEPLHINATLILLNKRAKGGLVWTSLIPSTVLRNTHWGDGDTLNKGCRLSGRKGWFSHSMLCDLGVAGGNLIPKRHSWGCQSTKLPAQFSGKRSQQCISKATTDINHRSSQVRENKVTTGLCEVQNVYNHSSATWSSQFPHEQIVFLLLSLGTPVSFF